MHEWALSDSIAAAAAEVAGKENLKSVAQITVVLGEVQDIAAGVFKDIFDEVKKQRPAVAGAQLVIETEPAQFECLNCGNVFGFERGALNHQTAEDIHFLPETIKLYIKCPQCGSGDFRITQGRGVYIKDISGDKK